MLLGDERGIKITVGVPHEIATGIDTAQPKLLERRKHWNTIAPAEFALPTEIWREVMERRQRYWNIRGKIEHGEIRNINDFITFNLDIKQYAQDAVTHYEGSDFITSFHKAICKITILDPTCGSGAFLFAALNILEPLYETCIDRMKTFVEEDDLHGGREFSNSRKVLSDIQHHPNLKYYIYKSIILNNLYGVDIMNEAVEIAKLRLFLKLVATVDVDFNKDNLGLEPLPDIDFNIRSGNTLVGFANKKELDVALKKELDLYSAKDTLYENIEKVSRTFKRFKEMQLEDDFHDYDSYKKSKDDLDSRLNNLNEELNKYLAQHFYGIQIQKDKEYQNWKSSHLPFHWFAEFYEIIHEHKGFDVIIGNPPYIVYNKSNFEYKPLNFGTLSCSNLFAFCAEKSFQILNLTTGKFGFIVPNSSISADKMDPLQKVFTKDRNTWISNFAWRPSKLFDGADMLLAIILTSQKKVKIVHSSKYYKWYNDYREFLFDNISYSNVTSIQITGSIPKLPHSIFFEILRKTRNYNKNIYNYATKYPSKYVLFYFRAVQYWIKILTKAPIFKEDGEMKTTGEMKPFYFENEKNRNIFISFLSSNLFFIHYITWASCQVMNARDFYFPFQIDNVEDEIIKRLDSLSQSLQNDYQNKSDVKIRYYSKKGRNFKMEKQHFSIKESKDIIDKIDEELCKHFGFTEEELDFIINYDIKYRMGKELNAAG